MSVQVGQMIYERGTPRDPMGVNGVDRYVLVDDEGVPIIRRHKNDTGNIFHVSYFVLDLAKLRATQITMAGLSAFIFDKRRKGKGPGLIADPDPLKLADEASHPHHGKL